MSSITATKEDLMQQQILTAAKELFRVYGLAKVTMDDVAKAIGKGRSSLYYYYKSKDEIFDAVVNAAINDMITAMEKAAEQATTVEAKINALFTAKLKRAREQGSFFNAMDAGMDADAMSNFNKTKIAHHDLILKRESALFTRILTDGIEKGELKPIQKGEMETLIFVLLSCLHGIKQEMRITNNEREIAPVIHQFTKMIMNGLYQK